MPRGCAVAYTDKGTGSGWFDLDSHSGVALDGTRAGRGTMPLEFEPPHVDEAHGIAVKHAHSGDNPEADWGRHVLQAVRFGLAMLDRAYPVQAPFTPANTRVIVTGVSNGAGAALQAAGLDDERLISVHAINSPREFMLSKKLIAQGARLDPRAVADVNTPFKTVAEAARIG